MTSAPAVSLLVRLTQAASVDDGSLQVEFAAGCQFEDHVSGLSGGGRDDFLRGMSRGDDLSADGELHRDGRFVAGAVTMDHVCSVATTNCARRARRS